MTDRTYLETLQLYYEEEIEGEAYFNALAEKFGTPALREKITLLAEVERHAARSVLPLLERYGLTPRPARALREVGRQEAAATAADWEPLIAQMSETYPGYLDDFHRLEAMAPEADRARLSFLTEHEVAALAFLELEARAPESSTAPLRQYLHTDPEAWSRGAI